MPIDADVEECMTSAKGSGYKGTANVTENGYTCQAWNSQSPHTHDYGEKLKNESNYCRNPDDDERPWCYTNSTSKKWEYCSIPLCGM